MILKYSMNNLQVTNNKYIQNRRPKITQTEKISKLNLAINIMSQDVSFRFEGSMSISHPTIC